MKRRLLRGAALAALGFVALAGLRLGYGYWAHPNRVRGGGEEVAAPSSFQYESKNYASKKVRRGAVTAVDQKYEKIADVRATSRDFERDEVALRGAIDSHDGLVQYERREGLAGQRTLHMAVGVDPARFDDFIARVQAIGRSTFVQVSKNDKTNDFEKLEAQRAALVETRDALVALEGRGGSIEEQVTLQQRILELRQSIQDLGIELGEFDSEHEFCTVKVTLAESHPSAAVAITIPFVHRARVALAWTLPVYLRLLGLLLSGALIALVLLVAAEKWELVQRVRSREDRIELGTALHSHDRA